MNKAWQRAREIADLLPTTVSWSFCITDIKDDAVFNIYASREEWHALRVLLALGRGPDFRYDSTTPEMESYEEYTIDSMTLSFIEPKRNDDGRPDESDGELADACDRAADGAHESRDADGR